MAVLVVAYVALRPALERRFGWELPAIVDAPAGDRVQDQRPGDTSSDRAEQPAPGEGESIGRDDDSRSTSELGQLTEISPDVFESTAGLRYGPGSREGHRLKHVLLHARDQPNRTGSHGVFDGDRETILALLDEAFQIAQERGPPVEIEEQGARTVYTVDMDRRVGYVGGQRGGRRNHPACRHVRMVLEGNNVITAFPLTP